MANLEITYVNIGQGDCTLIKCPDGKTVMIDCGMKHGSTNDDWQNARNQKDVDDAALTKLQRAKIRPKNYAALLSAAQKKLGISKKAYKDEKDYVNLVTAGVIKNAVASILPLSKKIDYLILTHHDDDHYSEVANLTLQGVKFGKVYYSGPIEKYRALRKNYYPPANVDEYISVTINGVAQANQTIIEKATDVTILCQTSSLDIIDDTTNDVKVTILASNVHTNPADKMKNVTNFNFGAEDINGRSIVTMIKFKNDKILVLGDATTTTESFLVSTYGAALQADTLRVGHHGSETSSSQALIDKVQPGFALISCAKYNFFGLPRKLITDRYITYFTASLIDVDQHDLSFYKNKDDYMSKTIKQALWQTWSIAINTVSYDGA